MNEEQVISVCRALLIERATDLARSGAYEEAEQALSEAKSKDDEDPIIFDLLARIRAQQGRYREAEAFWKEAARLDPGNAAYCAGLARVRAIQRHPYLPISWTPVFLGLAALTLLGLGGGAIWSLKTNGSESRSMLAAIPSLPSIPLPPIMPERAAPQPPKLDLTMPGILLATEGNAVLVTFENGLFDSGIRLLPEAEKTLRLVAHQLQSQGNGVRVDVVGHTNDLQVPHGSPFTDNVDLGLRRAVVVTNVLRRVVGATTNTFTVSSQGEANPPYGNDGPHNRTKNRTVLLHIRTQSF